jgi:hypothetical protein
MNEETSVRGTTRVVPAVPEVDNAFVETVAAEVASIVRRSGFDRSCSMGQTILDRFYGGSEALWSARSKGKLSSIRRLARQLKGLVRATELYRSVHVWLVCQALPFVPTSEQLTVSHVDAVLGLPRVRQEQLLCAAQRDGLTVRELRRLRRLSKLEAGEARGRPRSPLVAKAGTRIRQALAALDLAEQAITTANETSEPLPEELGDLLERLRHQTDRLMALTTERLPRVSLKAPARVKHSPKPALLRSAG